MPNEQLELQYELDEAQAEISRHHVALARVSLNAARAETIIRNLHPSKAISAEELEELHSCVRTIRNTVG